MLNSRLSISDFWFQIQWFQGQIHSQSSPSISLAFFPEPSGEIMTNVNSRYQTLPKKVPLKLLSGLEYLTKVYSGTGWAQELGVGAGGWNIINVFVPWSLEIYIFLIWIGSTESKMCPCSINHLSSELSGKARTKNFASSLVFDTAINTQAKGGNKRFLIPSVTRQLSFLFPFFLASPHSVHASYLSVSLHVS